MSDTLTEKQILLHGLKEINQEITRHENIIRVHPDDLYFKLQLNHLKEVRESLNRAIDVRNEIVTSIAQTTSEGRG